MISVQRGDAAIPEIQKWVNGIIHSLHSSVRAIDSYHDPDSNTYVIRLVKGSRVLLFRLSEAQVHTLEREAECEKTVRRRVGEMEGLLR